MPQTDTHNRVEDVQTIFKLQTQQSMGYYGNHIDDDSNQVSASELTRNVKVSWK